jgi:hypothetical protein
VDFAIANWRTPTAQPAALPVAIPLGIAISRPGDLAEWLVKQVGFKLCPAKCRAMQDKMNSWSWAGCVLHRKEIIDWFVGQAKAHKVKLSSDDALGLLKAGIREMMKRRNQLR